MKYEAKTLEPRLASLFLRISNQLLKSGIDTDVLADHLTDTVQFEFKKTVWSDHVASKTLRFKSSRDYRSPRHAFLDSLPRNSWRRRFWAHWWGIDPNEDTMRVKMHEVTVDRWVTFPDAEIYPDELGKYHYLQEVKESAWWV